jgi:acid phosphatase type 7
MRGSLVLLALVLSYCLLVAADYDSKKECSSCQNFVNDIYQGIPENTTDTEIINVFEDVCDKVFKDSAKCAKDAELFKNLVVGGNAGTYRKYTPFDVCLAFGYCDSKCCLSPSLPEQIHLQQVDESTMIIHWTTLDELASECMYGTSENALTRQLNGTRYTSSKGSWVGYFHRCVLNDLKPGVKYYYKVGDKQHHSLWHPAISIPVTWFEILPAGIEEVAQKPFQVAFVADMGATDASDDTVQSIYAGMSTGDIRAVIHHGDISYADGVAYLWDTFLRKVEGVASRITYWTTPGNHEGFFDFVPYALRFDYPAYLQSPKLPVQLWKSVNAGGVHFVLLNSEGPLSSIGDLSPLSPQYAWLNADLAAVNRSLTPWIVVVSHRPFYCSASRKSDCVDNAAILREYCEDLFHKYHVDLVISGHVHSYERTFPVYQGNVTNGADRSAYDNPSAPVYLLNGSAGCKEQLMNGWVTPAPTWSANHNGEHFGWSRLSVSATSLTWDFVAAEDATNILDTFTLSRS